MGEVNMPRISNFQGIVIRMQFEDHNPPHFHAVYSGIKSSFTFDGEVLAEGKKVIPDKQKALIKAWALLHSEDLAADWDLCRFESDYFVIEGLK
jgi:hypothetical protein